MTDTVQVDTSATDKKPLPLLRLVVIGLASFSLSLYGLIWMGRQPKAKRLPMVPGITALPDAQSEKNAGMQVNQLSLQDGVRESALPPQKCLDDALHALTEELIAEPAYRKEGDMIGAMVRLRDGRILYLRAQPRGDGGSILRTMVGEDVAGEENRSDEVSWLQTLPPSTARVYAVRKQGHAMGRLLYCFESELSQKDVIAFYDTALTGQGYTRQQMFEKQMEEQTGAASVVYIRDTWQVLFSYYAGKNKGCDYAILVQKRNAPDVQNP